MGMTQECKESDNQGNRHQGLDEFGRNGDTHAEHFGQENAHPQSNGRPCPRAADLPDRLVHYRGQEDDGKANSYRAKISNRKAV